jgi:hypothetical protein
MTTSRLAGRVDRLEERTRAGPGADCPTCREWGDWFLRFEDPPGKYRDASVGGPPTWPAADPACTACGREPRTVVTLCRDTPPAEALEIAS